MKILSCILTFIFLVGCFSNLHSQNTPRVFVFTDINIDSGDPDDRQSLVHLLWYANELRIEGVVPERWNASGIEACELVAEAYAKDYFEYNFKGKNYPEPEKIESLFATGREDAIRRFQQAASVKNDPLYVLIWGSMHLFGDALRSKPEVWKNIRVITIGTDLMMEAYRQHIPENWEKTEKPCEQFNWNGNGRNEIFNDSRFDQMWWLEINWTYEGMFTGEEPREMFNKLSEYGTLGSHLKEVVKNENWAQYFRVGDTPSVLYVIDPGHDLNNPIQSSWAGKFIKPFPEKRPNYFADWNGPVEWNYSNPCETWENHVAFRDHAKSTLEAKRPEMYDALLKKLKKLYKN
jgi:thiol-disulfide isomerase/thioredoxin